MVSGTSTPVSPGSKVANVAGVAEGPFVTVAVILSVGELRIGILGRPKNAPTESRIGPMVARVREAWKKASA